MNQNSDIPQKLSIKSWAEADRPREKMMKKGRSVLTNAELLGILIGSGVQNESAVDIAKRILASVDHDLNKIGKLGLTDLKKFKGIGEARAITISAALELGRRRQSANAEDVRQIKSSKDSFDVLYPYLADLDHEQFYVLLMNRSNKVIDVVRISQGGVAGTVADAKLIFKAAIDKLASSIIISHNHPSGNLRPSQSDLNITKTIKEAGQLLEISVLDHIIIAGESYFNFADDGII